MKVVETAPNAKSSMSKVRTARGAENFGPGLPKVSLLPFSSGILPSASCLLKTDGRGWQSSLRAAWLWKKIPSSSPGLKKSPPVAPQMLQTKLQGTVQVNLLPSIKLWDVLTSPCSSLLWQFLQNIFKQDIENLENNKFLPNPAFQGKT